MMRGSTGILFCLQEAVDRQLVHLVLYRLPPWCGSRDSSDSQRSTFFDRWHKLKELTYYSKVYTRLKFPFSDMELCGSSRQTSCYISGLESCRNKLKYSKQKRCCIGGSVVLWPPPSLRVTGKGSLRRILRVFTDRCEAIGHSDGSSCC
jgi:hypothetical protein